jgi:triacylglycerol lipase
MSLPIVLAHGIARFDILSVIVREKLNLPETNVDDQFEYFKGIKTHLESHGFIVSHPNQAFTGSVDLRAEQLAARVNEMIDKTEAPQVHVIAHSMGGLDARHMIVDKGMADRVATLTTIGTPHHGSPVADKLTGPGGALLLQTLENVFHLDVDGVADLTTTACEVFNRRAEDSEARNSVVYQTYSSSEKLSDVFAPLVPGWIIVRDAEGKNDGLVSVQSQRWVRELVASDGRRKPIVQKEFPFPADHLNEVGWWDPQESINPLFGGDLIQQAHAFEVRVRNLYLEIAKNL